MHERIKARVREKLLELRPAEAISGMAQGFDQWAAQICVELGIPFVAAVPFPGQELAWPWYAQQPYHPLLKKAARVHIVDPEPPKTRWEAARKLHARNRWMVDKSNAVIACWDGSDEGGTAECLEYAREAGRPIHQLERWAV